MIVIRRRTLNNNNNTTNNNTNINNDIIIGGGAVAEAVGSLRSGFAAGQCAGCGNRPEDGSQNPAPNFML